MDPVANRPLTSAPGILIPPTTARTTWDGADFSCFRRPSEVAFKIVGSALQSCACGDNTCTTIATLPAVPQSGWLPRLLVSADRRTVVVGYDWGLNSLPTSYPEIVALRANGDVIGRFSFGFAELDDTGQLLLIRPWLPGGRDASAWNREPGRGNGHLARSAANSGNPLRVIALDRRVHRPLRSAYGKASKGR